MDNEVVYLDQLYRMYVERGQKDYSRMQENFKFFSALDFGQWTPTAVQQHVQERRPITTFNFIKGKVEHLAGSFLQDPYDTAFESAEGGPRDDALMMQSLFMADKEIGGWDFEKAKFIRDGLIHMGVMEMTVNYEDNPLGHIDLNHSNPFSWRFDPNWVTDDVNDCKYVIKTRWMDAEEIRYFYPKKVEQIESAIELFNGISNTNSGDAEIDKVADRSAEYYDTYHHRYKVIQVMQIRREATRQLFDTEKQVMLPLMDKVNTTMMKVLKAGTVKEVINRNDVCWVKTICPALSLNILLSDGPHPLMCKKYPLFVWSSTNLHGERQGYVDILKDPQMTYNKREATYTHAQTTASNGALLVESNFFEKGERERFILEKSIPGSVFIVKDGTIQSGRVGISQVPREKMPTDMVESADRARETMNSLTPTPPSVTGGEGKSGESAELFKEKKETALTALVFPNLTLQKVDHEIGAFYFDAAKFKYAGVPREIKNPKTKEVVAINLRTPEGIANDISKVKRANVVVSQSKAGYSVRREKVERYIQVSQYVKNPLMSTYLEAKMVEGMPGFTDAEVADAHRLSAKYMELQEARVDAELAQMRQVAQQAGGVQSTGTPGAPAPGIPTATGPSEPGKTPAEGGGFSVEGKKTPPLGGNPVDLKAQNQLQ